MSRHSPEPWEFSEHEDEHVPEPWHRQGKHIINDKHCSVTSFTREPDGQRIVACVNACAGLNPEAVPEMLAMLVEANDFANKLTFQIAEMVTMLDPLSSNLLRELFAEKIAPHKGFFARLAKLIEKVAPEPQKLSANPTKSWEQRAIEACAGITPEAVPLLVKASRLLVEYLEANDDGPDSFGACRCIIDMTDKNRLPKRIWCGLCLAQHALDIASPNPQEPETETDDDK